MQNNSIQSSINSLSSDVPQSQPTKYSIEDFKRRAQQSLERSVHSIEDLSLLKKKTIEGSLGDHILNSGFTPVHQTQDIRAAAVLVPVIARKQEAYVILTKRSDDHAHHAGQISFPGGVLQANDHSFTDTALREAEEEIALQTADTQIIGSLKPYYTATGFVIIPIISIVSSDFVGKRDPREVVEIFEVPLQFLMSKENHQRDAMIWQGQKRHFHAMPYKNYYIWGATAGILHNLYERLYSL